jgi:hypothetical protein
MKDETIYCLELNNLLYVVTKSSYDVLLAFLDKIDFNSAISPKEYTCARFRIRTIRAYGHSFVFIYDKTEPCLTLHMSVSDIKDNKISIRLFNFPDQDTMNLWMKLNEFAD